jgi:hypothetical protein
VSERAIERAGARRRDEEAEENAESDEERGTYAS